MKRKLLFLLIFFIPICMQAQVSNPDSAKIILPRAGWTGSASTAHSSGPIINALDNNTNTYWSTSYGQGGDRYYIVDMKNIIKIDGIYIVQRFQNDPTPRYTNGSNLVKVKLSFSNDGIDWSTPIGSYILKEGLTNFAKQFLGLPSTINTRFYKIIIDETVRQLTDGDRTATIAETGAYQGIVSNDTYYNRAKWIVSTNSFDDNEKLTAYHLTGYDNTTKWQSKWSNSAAPYPHIITIDMGRQQLLNYIAYVQGSSRNSRIHTAEISFSNDGVNFSSGVLISTIFKDNSSVNYIRFTPVDCRYFRISVTRNYFQEDNPTSTISTAYATSLAEIMAGYDVNPPSDNLVVLPPRYQTGTNNTPLMGWASWNNYRTNISDSIIKSQVDAIVAHGLDTIGFTYVNIDDGFFDGRDENGVVKLQEAKFPNGMQVISDYIHSKGLKAGIYSDGGSNTCGSIYDNQLGGINVGLYGYEQQDLNMYFNSWGFDYIKLDWCGGQQQKLDLQTQYTNIYNALLNTNAHDPRMNLCRWRFPGTWAIKMYDSWRISRDITLSWSSVKHVIDQNSYLAPYASVGHYNDMDMLQIGRGLTFEEDKSHFSMWCIMSSPLILGNDLTTLTNDTKKIITNTEVIALNQDQAGLQAQLISNDNPELQIWYKSLNHKDSKIRGVVMLNRSDTDAIMTLKFNDILLGGNVQIRDLWLHRDLGSFASTYEVFVPAHGCVTLKLTGERNLPKQVFEAEYAFINNLNLSINDQLVPQSSGRAAHSNLDNASGEKIVKFLGNSATNWIEFRDVYAPEAGTYTMKISYISGANRNLYMSVNGGSDVLFSGLNSGNFSTVGIHNANVALIKGYNTIKFYHPTENAPDLDKIELLFTNMPQTISFDNFQQK